MFRIYLNFRENTENMSERLACPTWQGKDFRRWAKPIGSEPGQEPFIQVFWVN